MFVLGLLRNETFELSSEKEPKQMVLEHFRATLTYYKVINIYIIN